MLDSMKRRWHLILGQLLVWLGRPQSAAPHFQSVVAVYPQHLRAHLLLGWSQFHLKQYERAISIFDRALQINPTSALAHAHEGLSWMYLEQYQEATRSLEGAFRIRQKYRVNPKYVEALGWCYSRPGELEKALETYRSAEQLTPQSGLQRN